METKDRDKIRAAMIEASKEFTPDQRIDPDKVIKLLDALDEAEKENKWLKRELDDFKSLAVRRDAKSQEFWGMDYDALKTRDQYKVNEALTQKGGNKEES